MLATLGGTLALLVGLAVLLLPLLATELSRPRDSAWGALILLLGLVLVTTADRLTGAPMLAVLCGGLLIGRLGTEVGQARWCQLSPEERQRLWSAERWRSSFEQLAASMARLLQLGRGMALGLGGWITERRQPRPATKRWVRPEPSEPQPAEPGRSDPPPAEDEMGPPALVVNGFAAIDALIQQAITPSTSPEPEAATPSSDPPLTEASPSSSAPQGSAATSGEAGAPETKPPAPGEAG